MREPDWGQVTPTEAIGDDLIRGAAALARELRITTRQAQVWSGSWTLSCNQNRSSLARLPEQAPGASRFDDDHRAASERLMDPETRRTFGQLMRDARKCFGLTQVEAATAAGDLNPNPAPGGSR
jgi:hypothetical protein